MSSLMVEKEEQLPIAFRFPAGRDWEFVVGYWVDSFAKPKDRAELREKIHGLRSSNKSFVVAYNPEDPDREYLYGFGCSDRPLLYYVYVRKIFRCQGIGRQIIAQLGLGGERKLFCPCWSRDATAIKKKYPELLWRVS